MDIKQIQELIRFVSKSGVNEVSIEQEHFKITIKTNEAPTYVQATIPAVAAPVAPVAPAVSSPAPSASPAAAPASNTTENNNYITIKSPMIGTFYRSASPDKPPFVNVGDEVAAGKTLCVVEAMKLFNEIESEMACRIVKILVDNSSPIEFDQPLFLVEPI